MKNLKTVAKKLSSKLALHMVGLFLIVVGTFYITNHKDTEYRSDRDAIIELYMTQISMKDSTLMLLQRQQFKLEDKLDSLEKVKQQIIIKNDEKIRAIYDASAAEHAYWLDSILTDLDN